MYEWHYYSAGGDQRIRTEVFNCYKLINFACISSNVNAFFIMKMTTINSIIVCQRNWTDYCFQNQ